MPDRYNAHDYHERKNMKKHIKNTDNENTRFFDVHSDNENTAELSTSAYRQHPSVQNRERADVLQRNNRRQNHRAVGQQHPLSRPPQSRSEYYGSDSPANTGETRQRSPRQRPSGNPHAPVRHPAANGNRKTQAVGSSAQYQKKKGSQPAPPARNPQEPPKKRKKKKHGIIFRILTTLLIIFLLLFGIYSCTAVSLIKNLNYEESSERAHSASALSANHVTNILLIGTDGRTENERGRSDSMILLSLNSKTDSIILTSLLRDSYVNIPGHGMDKLTHAYSYGGPDLLMETVENNFSVRIDDYVSVNFNSFASIVDAVGGIEIEITDAEAREINTILQAEVNELMGDPVNSDLLKSGGKIRLNGKQALSYARIRYVGNADFERTERQRRVLTEIAGKLKSFKPSVINKIADEAIPQISTNMSKSELYLLSLRLPFLLGDEIDQLQIPADGTYQNAVTSNGGSALQFDDNANLKIIKEKIFAK